MHYIMLFIIERSIKEKHILLTRNVVYTEFSVLKQIRACQV